MSSRIAPLDLAAERASLGPALEEAVLRVLASGQYVLGPEVKAFEEEFAAYQGAKHCVGVGSGTDALILGLRALGAGPGTSVVTSAFSFFASAGTIAWTGARPILADVDPETALLTPEAAGAALEEDTAAIVPVHLYGQMADMEGFRALADSKKVGLLEDAAQAHGARRDGVGAGVLGDAAAFSFYPTKNLGAIGEGGALVTNDGDVLARLRRLRDHGSEVKYRHAEIGTNSRLQGMQGAALRVKLPHLEGWNERRRAIAARYDAAFETAEHVRPLRLEPGATHAYHQYTVRVSGSLERDAVVAALAEREIFAGVHYPMPIHLQEAAKDWGYSEGDFPHSEALSREVVCLPVHPFLTDADADRVASALVEIAG
jgi:dTDP-4-amino-4,6-dideoxygalactose transaminase